MKKVIIILYVISIHIMGCSSLEKYNSKTIEQDVSGEFKLYESTARLELKDNGDYILYNHVISHLPIEQCEYASTGKWKIIDSNIIEILSDDYISKQKGYEYHIKKESKYSQDSLYLNIVFPVDLLPVKFIYGFNYHAKSEIETEDLNIVVPKANHLFESSENDIMFSFEANPAGQRVYHGRIRFKIFEESIDTNTYNYFTISLPNIDRCFIEFEPIYKDLLMIKDNKTIVWKGESWEKQK